MRGADPRRVRLAADGSHDALGAYLPKIAAEVTASQRPKDSRAGRSPFAILRDAIETDPVDDLELWWGWEPASHGRAPLTWSLGERERRTPAGVRDEPDELLAAQNLGSEDVIALSGDAWQALCRECDETELLDLAETDGRAAMTWWLDARGLG